MNNRIQLKSTVKSGYNNYFDKSISFFKNAKKFLAFTLAETLMVMGIIGIVATLTIPNLNNKTNDREKVAKLKKVYAELNEAQNRAVAKYGPLPTWFVNDTTDAARNKRYLDRISKFVNVRSSYSNGGGSFKYKDLYYRSNNSNSGGNDNQQLIILNNDVTIVPSVFSTCNDYFWGVYEDYCGKLLVDIDTQSKGENVFGIDIFHFCVTKNGVVPFGGAAYVDHYINNGYSYGPCSAYGDTCTGWVIENDNMDYLKTPHRTYSESSDFGKCPNGKLLGYGSGQVKSCN
ncbi:MAG: type II secretion system protein [Candidatus Gastranaerophilaceae bacterium]